MVTGPIGKLGVINRPSFLPLFEDLAAEGGTAKTPPRMLVNSGIGRWVSQRQSGNHLAARLRLILQSHRQQPLP